MAMSRFLRAIRSEVRRRNAPAVQQIRATEAVDSPALNRGSGLVRSVKRSFGFFLRSVRAALALAAAPPSLIVFPEGGHKYQEVEDELRKAAGEQTLAFWAAVEEANSVKRNNQGHAVVAVVCAYFKGLRIWRSKRLRPYSEVLFLVLVFEAVLKRRSERKQYWVVIGDLTTQLIALAAACRSSRQGIIYWQYSNLDFKELPVPADYAVILNKSGRSLARLPQSSRENGKLFWRPRPEIEAVRLETLEAGPIGAFLNVHAGQNALEILARLQAVTKLPVLVRLHPNSSPESFDWPDTLQIAPSGQPLEDFSRSVSIAVCGNTQAQAKSLGIGTPVVQIEGLDPLEYDHHGYVTSGIVYGLRSLEDWSFDAVRKFYSHGNYRRALEGLMGPAPKNRKPGLAELLSKIRKESAHPESNRK